MPEEPALRNGLSLPRSGCPFRGHLSGIIAPGLPLQRLAMPRPNPFGSELPSSGRLCGPGRINAHGPLPGLGNCNPPASSRLAPHQALSGPPARRSARFSPRKLTLAGHHRSSAPRFGFPCRSASPAHRSGALGLAWARCSVNLSEPSPSCNESPRSVNSPGTKNPRVCTTFICSIYIGLQTEHC